MNFEDLEEVLISGIQNINFCYEFNYRVNLMILSTTCDTHVNKGVHRTKDRLLT